MRREIGMEKPAKNSRSDVKGIEKRNVINRSDI